MTPQFILTAPILSALHQFGCRKRTQLQAPYLEQYSPALLSSLEYLLKVVAQVFFAQVSGLLRTSSTLCFRDIDVRLHAAEAHVPMQVIFASVELVPRCLRSSNRLLSPVGRPHAR